MAIYSGSGLVKKVYYGTNSYNKVYRGSTLLYTGYEPETVALIARMDEQPNVALKELINTTIKGLKDDGVWQLADCMYVRGVHDSQAACLNWIKDAHNSTLVNSPTFSPKMGFQGNGTTYYINNNYNVYTQSSKLTNDSIGIVWMSTYYVNIPDRYPFGVRGSEGTIGELIRWSGGAYKNAPLTNAPVGILRNTDAASYRFMGFERITTQQQYYINGAYEKDGGIVSPYANLPDYNMYELARNNRGTPDLLYQGTMGFTFYGAALSSEKQLALYNRIKYFYDNVGGTF